MSLCRSIEDELTRWYEDPSHKALLVTGARQVGKTFAVREFMKEHYDTALEINFVETPQAKAIFEGNLDANTLIANITAFSGVPLVQGKSLVFFDEIQECPRARTAIKFLVDDGRFDYIESGSLLGVLYHDVPSLPVGYENVMRMYPLSLREFFVALGVQAETLDLLEDCHRRRTTVPTAIHERMLRLTRLYLACGGMPAAVDRLVQTQDLASVLAVLRDSLMSSPFLTQCRARSLVPTSDSRFATLHRRRVWNGMRRTLCGWLTQGWLFLAITSGHLRHRLLSMSNIASLSSIHATWAYWGRCSSSPCSSTWFRAIRE